MMENSLTSFSQITNQLSWNYVEWFRENWARPRNGKLRARFVTYATVWNAMKILVDAFEQAIPMRERGYQVMKEAPFDGRAPFAIAKREFGLQQSKKLDPIPDRIATPILAAAVKWVVERSEDIIALEDIWHREVFAQTNSYAKSEALGNIAQTFCFATDPETGNPWMNLDESYTRIDSDRIKRTIWWGDGPRRLVSDLVAACLIVVLGLTGMRSSDIASIEVKPDEAFPSCISVKRSLDGLTEYFLLNGVEQKSSHEPHSWVLGARLSGADDYPLTVQAIIVLGRLLARYRKASGLHSLVVTFGQARSLDPKFVGRMAASWLTNTQREFAINHANVLLKKHHRNQIQDDHFAFRSQQWRDTFAVFVVRTNKRSLGPLATHFNHVSTMMTELGYIGNDPELLGLLDDARLTLASNTIASRPWGWTTRSDSKRLGPLSSITVSDCTSLIMEFAA
jgi:integrase